jgi:class 3 adenylate cyclase
MIRIGAHGQRFWEFFYHRWNVFDFIIVVICLLPTAQYAAILRLVRILRILRLIDSIQQGEIHRLKNVELNQAYETLAKKNTELEHAYHQLEEEKAKSEWLLLNILPNLVAQRLKGGAKVIADSHDNVTVMFADIVGFTRLASTISAEELVAILDEIFRRFDHLVEHYGVEKIKTIGDAYMIVAGVPEDRADHTKVIADLSLAMLAAIEDYNRDTGRSLSIRIGFFSGPVVAGVIGKKKFVYDLWGDTVNIASRMESLSEPGKIQVAESTYQVLKDQYHFAQRNAIEVKGKGQMMTYFLLGPKTITAH